MFQNSIYYPSTLFLSVNSRPVFLKQPVQHTELSRVQQKAIV